MSVVENEADGAYDGVANGSRERTPDDRLREAIHLLGGKLDCFVAEFIIGPAEGRTRWLLAMTV